MKKLSLLFVPALAMVVFTTSCDKTPATTTPTTPTTPTTASPTPPSPSPSGGTISGALISVVMDYKITQAGFEVPFNSDIASTIFYNTPGGSTYVDAGTVSVNSTNLEKQTNNTYLKMANSGTTPTDLGLDGGSNWNVGGSSSVAAFTYNHSGSFPKFTGTVPSSLALSSGLSFTFNSSTTTGSDSVIVVVAAGSKSFTKTFAANAGTVNITATDLAGFPTVTDNTGLIEVCPYKVLLNTINGKQYAFVKEQAIVRNVNIN